MQILTVHCVCVLTCVQITGSVSWICGAPVLRCSFITVRFPPLLHHTLPLHCHFLCSPGAAGSCCVHTSRELSPIFGLTCRHSGGPSLQTIRGPQQHGRLQHHRHHVSVEAWQENYKHLISHSQKNYKHLSQIHTIMYSCMQVFKWSMSWRLNEGLVQSLTDLGSISWIPTKAK